MFETENDLSLFSMFDLLASVGGLFSVTYAFAKIF